MIKYNAKLYLQRHRVLPTRQPTSRFQMCKLPVHSNNNNRVQSLGEKISPDSAGRGTPWVSPVPHPSDKIES